MGTGGRSRAEAGSRGPQPRRARWRPPALLLALALGLVAAGAQSPIHSTAIAAQCPQVANNDYQGRTLVQCNFAGQDLTNANFSNAKLTSVIFIRTKLTNANFSSAQFLDSRNAVMPTDFSFATLDGANFGGAQFFGPVYLNYASLSCTDFSNTQLQGGNAIFGDTPLKLGANPNCRTKFRGATMNCEFIGQWGALDMTGAVIGACASELQTASAQAPGHDFSNGLFGSVVFDGLNLARSNWRGAVLERASFQGATLDGATGLSGMSQADGARLSAAKFNGASVQGVDMRYGQLYGADFTNANLSGSRLADAFLQANPAATPPIPSPAVFTGAHLKNVDLTSAKLMGANFVNASLYSGFGNAAPSATCTDYAKSCAKKTGLTCDCSSLVGSDLTGANFGGAYLFGVDFGGSTTTIAGTQFAGAVLIASNFALTNFQPSSGQVNFAGALMQGVIFSNSPQLANANFSGAFFDFGVAGGSNGNSVSVQLPTQMTAFNGWPASEQRKPCVVAPYLLSTVVPAGAPLVCPNGKEQVCGAATPAPNSNAAWNGGNALVDQSIPGWYAFQSTYETSPPPDPTTTCGGLPKSNNW